MKKLMCLLLLVSSIASAAEKNWMMRFRGIMVNPDESGTPTVIGGNANLSNDAVPEVDFTYFFNKNFALELILATSTHTTTVVGATNNTAAVDLGQVSLLPPTLTFQYHNELSKKVRGYVGAGINYTHFYGVKTGGVKSVDYDDSFGYAFQVGADYEIKKDVFINFDIKKVMLSTDLTATTYANTTVTADVDIDPWIVGMGVGYRF